MLRAYIRQDDRLVASDVDVAAEGNLAGAAVWFNLTDPTRAEDDFVESCLGIDIPTRAEMDNPELRPLIDLYYQGADMSAEDRIAIFRTAWDFVGSALAGRGELYERFYLASSHRMYQVAHAASVRETDFAVVDSVLHPPQSQVRGVEA